MIISTLRKKRFSHVLTHQLKTLAKSGEERRGRVHVHPPKPINFLWQLKRASLGLALSASEGVPQLFVSLGSGAMRNGLMR